VSCVQPSIASESKLSANSGNDSSSSAELKSLLINSTKNLASYKYSIDVLNRIILEQKDSFNKSNLTETSHEEGAINLNDYVLSQIRRSNLTSEGYDKSSEINELYLFNKTLYTRVNNKWWQTEDDSLDRQVIIRNVIQNDSYMINSSNIKLLGFKDIDGVECYWIKVEPDPIRLASILLNELDFPRKDIDLENSLSIDTIEWYSWITKDTHYLKRSDIKIALAIKAEEIDFPSKDIENIRIDSKINYLYKDYNQPVYINFSDDFKKAYPFPIKNMDISIFGVIQNENGYGDSYDHKTVYVDSATDRERANLIDIDDRYYESDYRRTIGSSNRRFFKFELPSNTTIKKIRFEPMSYGSSTSPVAFDLILDQLGSLGRNPIRKWGFNSSSDEISIEIYSIDQEDSQYRSSESLLNDITIDLKVTNNGENELPLNLNDFSLTDQFEWEYACDDYESSLGTLLPGESRRFDLVIPDVSVLSNLVTLKYKTLNINLV